MRFAQRSDVSLAPDVARIRVVIFGAGGYARELADLIRLPRLAESFEIMGFIERDASRAGESLNDLPILGGLDSVDSSWGAVIGAGDTAPRRNQILELRSSGLSPVTLVHPSADVSAYAQLGGGCVLAAHTVVSSNAELGEHALVNYGATVGHDVTCGDNCVIGPGAHVSGWCVIGDDCYLGAGAVVLPRVTIGDSSVVGAGAVVTRDVAPGETVVGIPAKPIELR